METSNLKTTNRYLTINRNDENKIDYLAITSDEVTYDTSKTNPGEGRINCALYCLWDKEIVSNDYLDILKAIEKLNEYRSINFVSNTNIHNYIDYSGKQVVMSNFQVGPNVCEKTYIASQGYYPFGTIVEDGNGNQFQNIGGFLFYKIK